MGKKIPAIERLWPKINKTDTCWLWISAQDTNGYGQISVSGRLVMAHRFVYETVVGSIPSGMVLDHLCRTPLCVRPDHLEIVTPRENTLRGENFIAQHVRKTHCPQGHPYDDVNTRLETGGTRRRCIQCHRAADARYRAKRKGQFNG